MNSLKGDTYSNGDSVFAARKIAARKATFEN